MKQAEMVLVSARVFQCICACARVRVCACLFHQPPIHAPMVGAIISPKITKYDIKVKNVPVDRARLRVPVTERAYVSTVIWYMLPPSSSIGLLLTSHIHSDGGPCVHCLDGGPCVHC